MKKFLFCLLILLTGCSTSQKINEETPSGLYLNGYRYFKSKDYEKSIKYFDQIEQQFPYSIWSERSQIMMAYSQYLQNEYTDAILTLDRFLQLHPGNRNAAYALYLKGLCYYEQISDPTREQEMTELADSTFRQLLARFGKSIYAEDAKAKLVMIQNNLAAKELSVGRYYQKREDFIAAMNRFQTALEWPESTQFPEALYRLGVTYKTIGMVDQFEQIKKQLEKDHPNSMWTEKIQNL